MAVSTVGILVWAVEGGFYLLGEWGWCCRLWRGWGEFWFEICSSSARSSDDSSGGSKFSGFASSR
eukprot:scaffold9958_cov47-Attheya_sp.AAC.2